MAQGKRGKLSGAAPVVRLPDARRRNRTLDHEQIVVITHSRQRHAIARSLPMTPTITACERSPDGGKGLARDTRVRWALEEVGQPYEARLVSFRAMKEPAHLVVFA